MSNRLVILCCSMLLPILVSGQWKFDENKISSNTKVIVSSFHGKFLIALNDQEKDYDSFQSLVQNASKDELMQLVNHPEAIVRCYSFWALSQHDSVDIIAVLLNHNNDTTDFIGGQLGCFPASIHVRDFFEQVVTDTHYNKGKVVLTEAQKGIIYK